MNPQITLLDYFAGLALQAILLDSYGEDIYVGDDNDSEKFNARSAYIQALAMLEMREVMVKRLMLEQADESSVN